MVTVRLSGVLFSTMLDLWLQDFPSVANAKWRSSRNGAELEVDADVAARLAADLESYATLQDQTWAVDPEARPAMRAEAKAARRAAAHIGRQLPV